MTTTKGKISLLDKQDLFETMYDYFKSEEWYIFFVGYGMSDFISEVEEEYYKPGTPANRDFEIVIRGVHGPIVFAKKSRMSLDQLMKLMKPHISKDTLKNIEQGKVQGKDCFIISNNEHQWSELVDFAMSFNMFVKDKEMKDFQARGEDPTEGKKCYYHVTIPAREAGEQSIKCDKEVIANVSGFGEDGELKAIWLCKEHYERIKEFIGE